MKISKIIILLNVIWCFQMGCSSSNNFNIGKKNQEKCDLIYWQPNVKITYLDFMADTSDQYLQQFNQKYNPKTEMMAAASVSLNFVLDIPKDKNSILNDKVYIVPAFCRKHSYTLTKDSMQIAKQILYFEMYESFARQARKSFKEYQDSIQAYYKAHGMIITGTISASYPIIVKDIIEKKNNASRTYTEEVFIHKIDGAYEKWRDIIKKILEENEEFATKPEDCKRFLINEPTEKNYKTSGYGVTQSN